MKIVKHGQKYIDLHKIYKLSCKKCGCEFDVQRCEINVEEIGKLPITHYTAHRYKNYGLYGSIKCPECGHIVSCMVSLTHDEEEYLSKTL